MDDEITKLCEAIAESLSRLHKGDTASALWPFIPNEAGYYTEEPFIKELSETINKLKEKKYSDNEIALLFGNSAKIAQYFTLFHGAKILALQKRIELAKDLINFLAYYRKDPFCQDKSNILLADLRIDLAKLDKSSVSIEMCNKFSALLLLYLEVLYPTMMRLGHEFHGTYSIRGKKLFIKEFFNLNPKSLNFKEPFSIGKIKIVEEVESEVKLDFFNHLFSSPKKISSYIETDGKILNKEDLKKAYEGLEGEISSIIKKILGFSRKDWFRVYARGIFQSIDHLKVELKEKNEVPSGVFERIERENFELPIKKIVEFQKTHTKEEIKEITKNSYLKIFE